MEIETIFFLSSWLNFTSTCDFVHQNPICSDEVVQLRTMKMESSGVWVEAIFFFWKTPEREGDVLFWLKVTGFDFVHLIPKQNTWKSKQFSLW